MIRDASALSDGIDRIAGSRYLAMLHLGFTLIAAGLALGLFLAMLLFLELGRRVGVRRLEQPGARAGVGVADGMVYALLAFLLGFSFNGAATRFDNRRALVGDEANAAGTAWQRIDLLPVERQPAIRTALRAYIDALIAAYAAPSGLTNVHLEPAAVTRAENDLWTLAVAACRAREGEQARMLLLPGLNELFDAVNREYIARRIHPPVVIFVMLGLTALAGAVFVGYAIASGPTRNWIYMIGVAATISAATFVIVELEYPRLGLIRVDAMDQTLAEVRATMD